MLKHNYQTGLRSDDVAGATESEIIDATVKFFIRRQNKSFKPGQKARRALHGKSLGLVPAKMIVVDLPPELQQGIFSHQATHNAVVRFSNGSLGPNTLDILPNVRGVAVKVYECGQINVLAEEGFERGHESECDFLMVNSPTFFVRDIGFIEAIMKKKLLKVASYLPSLISNLVPATNRLVTHLLNEDYHSQVPHWFGDRPCKFSLIARQKISGIPNLLDRDYLRHGLAQDLKTEKATFDFCVQFKMPDENMETLTTKWSGPMLTLATLEIEQPETDIIESDGEALSFNPFRTPSAFQPAGWVGRMRKAVYVADHNWRQEKNSI